MFIKEKDQDGFRNFAGSMKTGILPADVKH